MKLRLRFFVLWPLLVVTVAAPPLALAGAPTDYLRTRIDKLYELLGGPGTPTPEGQTAARKVMDEMFDWPEMAKRTLGQHWEARSAAERAEFVRLFAELFQRTYLSRIQLADRQRFEYLGEAIDGERALVRTRVFTKQGRQIPVISGRSTISTSTASASSTTIEASSPRSSRALLMRISSKS
jgi:phospholipid transport system substrate-binding protein